MRLPTKGSLRILNASAANGSSSRAVRVMGSPFALVPLVGGISMGDGMNSMTASSSACTPLFLNAVPHMHSTISFLSERALRPRLISSSDSEPPFRYFSVSASSPSAAASIMMRAVFLGLAPQSGAGISRNSNFMPWVSMSQ